MSLRVLHVTPAFAPAWCYGGPIHNLLSLTREQQALGLDVRVLTTNAAAETTLRTDDGWTQHDGVPVRYHRRVAREDIAPGLYREVLKLARWADVIHATAVFSTAPMAGLLAGLAVATPVVISPRGAFQPQALERGGPKKQAWLGVTRPMLRLARFHFTSTAEATATHDVLGPALQGRVIPNGTQLPSQDVLGELTRSPTSTILMLGRVHPIKGIHRVIEALALLRKRGIPAVLEVVGPVEDERYADELQRLASDLAVADAVRFLPPVSGKEKLTALRRASVLALASDSENFGNVVVEALACERPVVATHGTPWAELEDRGCGAWVAADPTTLAAALEPRLGSAERAAEEGRRGRRFVESTFRWPAIAASFTDLYLHAIGRLS